ncbi:MAG: preprotein translocase subunit SecG [Clostridia bacterium]|nr:preprotein translocase subunit SecG [Clostridia bacterium]
MAIVISILTVLASIVLIVSVLMQEGDSDGISALAGGSSSDTFFGRNKSNTIQGKLSNITKISATVFVVLAIVMLLVK